MKYALMFFICGHSSGGYSHCGWQEAVILKDVATCREVLSGSYVWQHLIKIGDSRYLLAACFPKAEKVEK